MKSKIIFILFILLGKSAWINGQIIIKSDPKELNTVLETFSNQGRDSLQNVSEGRMILNSSSNCINYYSAGRWFSLCGACLPEIPMVDVDSVLFKYGRLSLYFNDKKAKDQNVERFQIKIPSLNWIFITDHSPFTTEIALDTTLISIWLSGMGECGTGTAEKIDSVLVYSEHPCRGETNVLDPRDNRSYELVELGNQCWIKGYLKFIPTTRMGYLNKTEAVFYEWEDFTIQQNNLCPAGYHIPQKKEADILADVLDNTYNQYTVEQSYDHRLEELKVEFIGGYDVKKDLFFTGTSDFFWVQDSKDKQEAYLGLINAKGFVIASAPKKSYMPVRCIKN
jgi:uncharacterized protein (TIGR02145 family)